MFKNDLRAAFVANGQECRDSYAAGFTQSFLAQQLSALRQSRELTVSELATLADVRPSVIKLYERDDNTFWDAGVLTRIAQVLGLRLRISFETLGSLLEEVDKLSPDSLWRPSFEEDLVFTGVPAFPPGPVGEMKRKLVTWLADTEGEKARLLDWLQGYDLPPVGDELAPYEWLLLGLIGEAVELRGELYARAAWIKVHLQSYMRYAKRPADLRANLDQLLEKLSAPAV